MRPGARRAAPARGWRGAPTGSSRQAPAPGEPAPLTAPALRAARRARPRPRTPRRSAAHAPDRSALRLVRPLVLATRQRDGHGAPDDLVGTEPLGEILGDDRHHLPGQVAGLPRRDGAALAQVPAQRFKLRPDSLRPAVLP